MDFLGSPPALVAFGVLVGIAAGLIGVGGGIFMVPYLVLGVGLSQHSAQATSLLVVLPTASVASWALVRRGVTDIRMPLRIGSFGVVGSIAGASLALVLPGTTLRIVFASLMCVVALRLLRDAARGPRRGEADAVAQAPSSQASERER